MVAKVEATLSFEATSQAKAEMFAFVAWRMEVAAAEDFAASRSSRATSAPWEAKSCAIAKPIPLAPPVMTARLPVRSNASVTISTDTARLVVSEFYRSRCLLSTMELLELLWKKSSDQDKTHGFAYADLDSLTEYCPEH
jgi:hypothetical protein